MPTIQAAMSGVPLDLIIAATTGTSAAIALPPSFIHHTIIVKAASGVTAGAVTIETANEPDYAGTWAIVPMENSVANPLTVTGGADLMMEHEGRLNFIRARINTTISGGGGPAVTVTYEGGKNY